MDIAFFTGLRTLSVTSLTTFAAASFATVLLHRLAVTGGPETRAAKVW
jgi:hypothetical protein